MLVTPGPRLHRLLDGNKSIVLLLVADILIALPGCISGYAPSLQFSPDSTTIVFVWGTDVAPPIGPERHRLAQSAYIRWCSVDKPGAVQSVKIDSVGSEYSNDMLASLVKDIKFSPDSRYLALVVRGRARCIDLHHARVWALAPEDEYVSSIAWLGRNEVGYGAFSNASGARDPDSYRVFWRHAIEDPPQKRRPILGGQATRADAGVPPPGRGFGGFQDEYWSPHGRYVIFAHRSSDGRLSLLDAETGRIVTFGRDERIIRSVAWKPDDSVAVCINQVVGWSSRPVEAVLLIPATAQSFDLTLEYTDTVGTLDAGIVAEWTPDGEFIVINDVLGAGAYLIRPRPWEALAVGQTVERLMGPLPQWQKSIVAYPLGKPGWIQTAVADRGYAFNYINNQIVDLGPRMPSDIVVSPDGSKIARLKRSSGRVTVKEINLDGGQELDDLRGRSDSNQRAMPLSRD